MLLVGVLGPFVSRTGAVLGDKRRTDYRVFQ
jgi:hypothetical protein